MHPCCVVGCDRPAKDDRVICRHHLMQLPQQLRAKLLSRDRKAKADPTSRWARLRLAYALSDALEALTYGNEATGPAGRLPESG